MSSDQSKEFYTIGRLVDELKDEFDNISVSKVRFLEAEGLLRPIRSKGGYRRFSVGDRERLRAILRLQNEEYLPLSVIKERLDQFEADGDHPSVASSGRRQLPRAAVTPDSVDQPVSDVPFEGQVTGEELAGLAGLSPADVAELEKFDLIKGSTTKDGKVGQRMYGPDAYNIACIVRELGRFGLEPRHLRMFSNFVGREAALCRQALGPIARRTPEARHRAKQSLKEIVSALNGLQQSLLAASIRENFRELH